MARSPTQERVRDPSEAAASPSGERVVGGAAADGLIGEIIDGRYQVSALIGAGAMGRVYRAEQVKVRRPVAIKVLDPALAAVPEIAGRFEREAVAIGRLDHPNCVSIWDAGSLPHGGLYLAMQLLPGPSLAEVLERGPMPIPRALRVARHILAGLAHAHAVGIVHRDIKPDNIILADYAGDPDFAVVLDFGVAKLVDGLEHSHDPRLTRLGERFGTPAYMSPEQSVGGAIDARTDLYAVAVILFEMIAGRCPFESDDPLALLAMHTTKTPPALTSSARRSVPPAVAALVARGLAKRAEDRFPDAGTFIAAIDGCAEPAAAGPARRRPPWVAQPAVAVGLAVAAALLIGLIAIARTDDDAAARARSLLAEGKPAEAIAYLEERAPAIADDAPAQLQLGHAQAGQRRYGDALDSYQHAVELDERQGEDPELRRNLVVMLDDDDDDVVVGAAMLLLELGDEDVRGRIAAFASRHDNLRLRVRMRELAESLGVGDQIDRVASYRLDLVQARACADRRAAVAKLRALGDARAIPDLDKARGRKVNECLAKDAEDAIRYLRAEP
jgi:tetratricopeptide (TPR) repeat protein